MLHEWAWAERPNRRFLSYAFILLCAEERRLNPMEEHVIILDAQDDEAMKEFVAEIIGNWNDGVLTYSDAYRQDCLSESSHEELIIYLAKVIPHTSSGSRSANEVYKRLTKSVGQFVPLPLERIVIANRRLAIHG